MPDFSGFPKEMVTFFGQLEKNNNKEWFDRHREDYETYVKGPSIEFVTAMGEKLRSLSKGIKAIPKVNQSLFRINRDTRFSHDKRPYKTNTGIWFWEGERKRMECSGFYFHMGDGKLMLGSGMHMFSKENLKRYRDAVIDKKKVRKLSKITKELVEQGYALSEKHYKKTPRGYEIVPEYEAFLLYNGMAAMIEMDIPKEFYTNAIVEYAFSHFKNMNPLHGWLVESIV